MCIYRHHPLIEGMLLLLPEHPGELTEVDLLRWLNGLEANLRLLYDVAVDPARQAAIDAGYLAAERAVVLPQLREDLVDAADRQATAAALEAERYNVDELEREAFGRPTPPAPADAALERIRGPLSKGGTRDASGRFVRRLYCPFVIEPDPDLAVAEAAHPCAQPCTGQIGLIAHISRAHHLRGDAHAAERDELVGQAVAVAEARLVDKALAADLEPERANGVGEYVRSSPADVDERAAALEPYAGAVPPDVIVCPYPLGRPAGPVACGAPMVDAVALDRHLRRDHALGDDQARWRVDLVDQALEELDARIATAGVDPPATLAATSTAAAPEGTQETARL